MRIPTLETLILAAGLALFAGGCGSSEELQQVSAEQRYTLAMELFNDENYLKAIEEFRVITLQHSGTRFADGSQFYMAECRYRREEFILASYEYDLLIRTMPTSPFVPRARYQRAMCYYRLSPTPMLDQEYSRKAIDEFQGFIDYSPTDSLVQDAEKKIAELNTKLARKEYNTGELYMTMEYYRAAIVSFDYVLEKYHDTEFAEPSLYRKAEACVARKKYEDAKMTLNQFLKRFPKSERAADARQLLADVEELIKQPRTKAELRKPEQPK